MDDDSFARLKERLRIKCREAGELNLEVAALLQLVGEEDDRRKTATVHPIRPSKIKPPEGEPS